MQREKPDVLLDETDIRTLSEYRLTLFAEARRHCADVGDAEELVLRTIDAALRDWESCQNKDSPLPWLLGILRNIRSKDVRRMVERNTVAVDPDILASNEGLATPDGMPKLVTVNSWNEWTEGSYLEPDTHFKFGYLEAVKRVFSTRPDCRSKMPQ